MHNLHLITGNIGKPGATPFLDDRSAQTPVAACVIQVHCATFCLMVVRSRRPRIAKRWRKLWGSKAWDYQIQARSSYRCDVPCTWRRQDQGDGHADHQPRSVDCRTCIQCVMRSASPVRTSRLLLCLIRTQPVRLRSQTWYSLLRCGQKRPVCLVCPNADTNCIQRSRTRRARLAQISTSWSIFAERLEDKGVVKKGYTKGKVQDHR